MARKPKGSKEEQEECKRFNKNRSFLRRCWITYPERLIALNDAKRPYKGPNKLQKWEYQCNTCKNWFKLKEVQVDHIVACGTLSNEANSATFVARLFCLKDGLQVLCKLCHQDKTNSE